MSTGLQSRQERVKLAIEIFIKVGLLFLVLYVSYLIVKPFLAIILWGIILAVAFSPMVDVLEKRFGGNRKKIVVAGTLVVIALLVVPTWIVSDTIFASAKTLVTAVHGNTQLIPEPSAQVKSWPLVGDAIYDLWQRAHDNLPHALAPFKPQIKAFIAKAAGWLKSGFGVVMLTIASVVVAAFLLISKESASAFYHRIMRRLLGDRGDEWADLSALTVRSVVTGVVGVAIIQSALALAGTIAMGVPLAPLWAFVILFFAIIQLPALIVIGPLIAYVFTYAEGAPATIFTIYMLLVGASDNVLKPMLMGRGIDIPMIVILVGAIGGMFLMGMIGLFLGAVILALTFKLFELWIQELDEEENERLAASYDEA